tara:strand:- start:605 stop:1165 length:561 start_codon:yes stop_codon:yes gene_type:complete
MKRTIKRVTLILCAIFLLHEIIIISDGLIDDDISQVNVAVILGSKVNTDGSLSERLKARLDCGLKLYTDTLVKEIYVSGGLGKEGHYEGTVMAEYLISKGVPRTSVKVDNLGVNTRSTAVNFKKDYPSETVAIVVSQYFHITRCKLAFTQVGISNVMGVHCDHFELRDPYSSFREFFGYYKYLLKY